MNVLIVANVGLLRDGLEMALVSLLDTTPFSVEHDERLLQGALQAAPPDLVILDAESAGAIGVRCVRAINHQAPQVLLIALVDRCTLAQAVLDAGTDRVLLKGSALTELAGVVRQFFWLATEEM